MNLKVKIHKQITRIRTDSEHAIDVLAFSGLAVSLVLTWVRERRLWQRLADLEVPSGGLLILVGALRMRQLALKGPINDLRDSMSELGDLIGKRLVQSDKRSAELLAAQRSMETMAQEADQRDKTLVELQVNIVDLTRWLVRLTIALGVIGVAGIAATIVAATS